MQPLIVIFCSLGLMGLITACFEFSENTKSALFTLFLAGVFFTAADIVYVSAQT
jgi:predicted membrane channel-forming protein YqfA (hemolysin III family)